MVATGEAVRRVAARLHASCRMRAGTHQRRGQGWLPPAPARSLTPALHPAALTSNRSDGTTPHRP